MQKYLGIWFSFYEFEEMGDISTTALFTQKFKRVTDHCAALGLNTIITHVHPFSDALYQSELFPSSHLITGRQGAPLPYDPLRIMAELAHAYGLRLEAWLNPYRVTPNYREIQLAKSNPAYSWLFDGSHRVIPWDGGLYYNPASPDVRALIIQGVEEIVSRYSVDAVQIDDYFYPATSPEFDRASWQGVCKIEELASWRRENVDQMVSGVYQCIHKHGSGIPFGVSPQGNNSINYNGQYCDISKWMAECGYIDYIMPQLYWGRNPFPGTADINQNKDFDASLEAWQVLPRREDISLYIGLGAYRIGIGDGVKENMPFWNCGSALETLGKAALAKTDGLAMFRYGSLFKDSMISSSLIKKERCALSNLLNNH